MTEKITKIELQAFRGVPGSFTLDLPRGVSCVVLGQNGTGKSSIADAIEWYFEGRIEFLKKEGRRGAARHSGARDQVETKVAIRTNGMFGGEISSSTPPRSRLPGVEASELLMLRGRTLAHFVEKTKGEKWDALATLLGFDAIDHLRQDLRYVRNSLEGEAKRCSIESDAKKAFLASLTPDVSESGILEAMKLSCRAAGVEPPESIDVALDSDWIASIAPSGAAGRRVAEFDALHSALVVASHWVKPQDLIENWNNFVRINENSIPKLQLIQSAASVLGTAAEDQNKCPLCGQAVDGTVFAAKIRQTLEDLESAESALAEAKSAVNRLLNEFENARVTRSTIRQSAKKLEVSLPVEPVSPNVIFEPLVSAVEEIDSQVAQKYCRDLAIWDANAIEKIRAAKPVPTTTREQSLVNVGILHTRVLEWQSSIARSRSANAAYDLAAEVFDRYEVRQRSYLDDTFKQISVRCGQIYEFLHPNEGIGGVAVETIGAKGAEIAVDHFGKKELPPQRVLSESHVNSLGLALFLAMAETFNEDIGFLVLDDIISSFDREHRGRLAELLVRDFSDTQLIVLTHDEQFFNRICVLAPSWARQEFTSWSFDGGPRTKRVNRDRLLGEAREAVLIGDRVGSAQKGRRAIEEFLQEACEAFEALLPFRRGQQNDQRMANEVIRGLRRTLKDRDAQMYRLVEPLLTLLEADLLAALNVESHSNQSGASMREIEDAINRIGKLSGHFTCTECNTRVWANGTPHSSRCNCGVSRFPSISPAGRAVQ